MMIAPTSAPPSQSSRTLNSLLNLPAELALCQLQLDLIYRAEGNANLVLALPQFKKVLRLPKMLSRNSNRQQAAVPEQLQQQQQPQGTSSNFLSSIQFEASGITQKNNGKGEVGDLTMAEFMAYIEIMRRLLGNEFVCEADIVAIPRESDRLWINDQIRPSRPLARLDKEFVGQFGLLLPDVTQLPATLVGDGDGVVGAMLSVANLQSTCPTDDNEPEEDSKRYRVNVNDKDKDKGRSKDAVEWIRGGEKEPGRVGRDTYAIEIKPKQGWLLLPSDVSDLFDLIPAIATRTTKTTETTTPTPLDHQTPSNHSPPTPPPAGTGKGEGAAKGSAGSTTIAATAEGKGRCCHCRYCRMQLLKLRNCKIKRLSSYCPLDLFSGTPRRMLDAMDALFACPQNNLRVFHNGNLIYGDHANSISCEELNTRVFPGEMMVVTKHLLVTALLREFNNDHVAVSQRVGGESQLIGVETKAPDADAVVGDGIVVVEIANVANVGEQPATTAQPKSTKRYTKQGTSTTIAATPTTRTTTMAVPTITCGIKSTRNVAKTETEAQAEAATEAQAAAEAEALATQAQINKAEMLCLPKNCVLQKILDLQLLAKRHFRHMLRTGSAFNSAQTYNALRGLLQQQRQLDDFNVNLVAPEQAYMLGATALDCSIMLTFQEIQFTDNSVCSQLSHWHIHLADFGRDFLTKVTVLDLDPKPDSHFHKYAKQTHEIEKCCQPFN